MNRAILLLALSSCSVLTIKGPDARRPPVCDEEGFFPAMVDGALGIMSVGGGAAACDDGSCSRGGAIALGLAGAALAVTSIVIGRNRIRECRAALTEAG